MNELLTLKRNALVLGLCGDYKKRWDSSMSKEDLVNMALDANGCEFITDACTFGWGGGFSPSYIKSTFGDYINGKYRRDKDGYTSMLYACHTGSIKLESTILILLGCDTDVIIPPYAFSKVYVGSGSSVRFHGHGKLMVFSYGNNNILFHDKEQEVTHITTTQWNGGI